MEDLVGLVTDVSCEHTAGYVPASSGGRCLLILYPRGCREWTGLHSHRRPSGHRMARLQICRHLLGHRNDLRGDLVAKWKRACLGSCQGMAFHISVSRVIRAYEGTSCNVGYRK